MKRSAMLQRQLKLQAAILTDLHMYVSDLKVNIGWFKASKVLELVEEAVKSERAELRKARKQIAKLDELQRFTKQSLQQAYIIEQIEKKWEAMSDVGNEESFLMGRLRMAAEDGFVEPGVVLETVEVK